MSYWEALLLGLVQGLTEFLPISSSGHLVLVEKLLGIEAPGVIIEVALHVATLAAVAIVYRVRIVGIVRGLFGRQPEAIRFAGLLVVASIPAAVVGLLFQDLIVRAFDSMLVVGIGLVVTGGMLHATRGWRGSREQPTLAAGLAIGIAQALAIVPGFSRSGATIATALWLDVEPVKAAEFSFLLSLVAISGAAILQLPDVETVGGSVGWGPLAAAFLVALVSGIAAIKLLVRLLAKLVFHRFASYCWLVGAATIVWAMVS